MAFHWFAYDEKSMIQLHRVLKPKGMLGVTWIIPDKIAQSYVSKVYDYLIPYFGEELHLFVDLEEENIVKQIALSKKFSLPESLAFTSHDSCDREHFYHLSLSFSAVQAMNEKDHGDYVKFCKQAMAEYVEETGNEITSLANTISLYWSEKI